MLRYAITDAGHTPAQVARWAAAGVHFVLLREPGLSAGRLLATARSLDAALRERSPSPPRLLVHSRADVAIACGAAGVHLSARPGELTAADILPLLSQHSAETPVVSVSCHTLEEVRHARDTGATLILFAPVFEKRVGGQVVVPGAGLEALRAAAALAPGRVLALGGVTQENAPACMAAGAVGVAGIRLFA